MADESQKTARKIPANEVDKELLKRQAKYIEDRKVDALSPEHKPKPNRGWKAQKELWSKASDDGKRDLIYGMVMFDGAIKLQGLCHFFGIKNKDLEPYLDVWNMAVAALKYKVQRNQISIGLQREDQVNLKFFLGKQFAGQVNDPAHEGVESVTAGPPTIIINETKGANVELRKELDTAVEEAISAANVTDIRSRL